MPNLGMEMRHEAGTAARRGLAAATVLAATVLAATGLAVTVFGAALSISSPAEAAVANLGTLKCILDPGTKEPFGVERELSCTYAPITGPEADFTGVVKKIGVETPSQEKIVMIWSVAGPQDGLAADDLEGRYIGSLAAPDDDANAPGLVGGVNSDIVLTPLTVEPDAGDNAATLILELDLRAMKA